MVAGDAATGAAVPFSDVKAWATSGTILRHLLRYDEVRLRTQLIETLPKPLMSALLIRLLSRGRCVIEDEQGAVQAVDLPALARLSAGAIRDLANRGSALAAVRQRLAATEGLAGKREGVRLDLNARPLYLRTDFVFGLISGGSVGHIAGVVNNLSALTSPPRLATTDPIPTVDPTIETWVMRPDGRYRDFSELPLIAFSLSLGDRLRRKLGQDKPAFIYQRYSLSNFTGLDLAIHYGVPLALEYNGSETWISRNWGGITLKYQELAERIEDLNLRTADLIIVVSDAMREELLRRGVDGERILVNPNGVEPSRYSPDVDPRSVRDKYGLNGKLTLGFIGTFGPWHGAETLADAFAELLHRRPEYRDLIRLLMIGDGATMNETQRRLVSGGAIRETVFVGRTAQADGASYMAACDILVSPHIPNADGTRFFGSPTKLFEYMAMGKAIVASELEQIAEVLEHDRTAWLVAPGDVDALTEGMQVLIEDPERRARLGAAARKEVLAKHTWRQHTGRIIEALQMRFA
jgi:glycosyltransferase involved in cell wall biosynthesis